MPFNPHTAGSTPTTKWSSHCNGLLQHIRMFQKDVRNTKRQIDAMNKELDKSNGKCEDASRWGDYIGLHQQAWRFRDQEWPQLNEYRIWEHRAFEVGQGEANNMTQLTALMYDVDVEVNNLPKVMKY
jgi:hypothetical protein